MFIRFTRDRCAFWSSVWLWIAFVTFFASLLAYHSNTQCSTHTYTHRLVGRRNICSNKSLYSRRGRYANKKNRWKEHFESNERKKCAMVASNCASSIEKSKTNVRIMSLLLRRQTEKATTKWKRKEKELIKWTKHKTTTSNGIRTHQFRNRKT